VILSSHEAGRRRGPLPRRVFVAAVAALIPALAGCEAGAHSPTQQWHQPTEGAAAVVHGISIRNVFVLGGSLTANIPAGQSAGLFLALVNNNSKPDRLLSVTAPGTATSVTLPGGTVGINSDKSVLLTGPAPKVVLTGLTRPLTGGTFINVVMMFQNAGRVTLSVPVMPRAQYYSTFSPAPAPSASPTPTATPLAKKHKHKHKHKAGAGATVSPSPSPSTS
jgi:copper(I)-binding protein